MATNSEFSGTQSLRPPIIGPSGALSGPQNAPLPMQTQFRPLVPLQQTQPYFPVPPSQFQPVGRPNTGVAFHNQQLQFPQAVQLRPLWSGQPGHVLPPQQAIPIPEVQPNRLVTSLPPQAMPPPEIQSNRPVISVTPLPQQSTQILNNYMPRIDGPNMPQSSSYSLPLSSVGQLQMNSDTTIQYPPVSQTIMPTFNVGGQHWPLNGSQSLKSVTTEQQGSKQTPPTTTVVSAMVVLADDVTKSQSEWIEHTPRDGRKRYYYNIRTKLSSWEKPLELMSATERADASTEWREFTSPGGRKYYYNRISKQSKWKIPEELKLARAQVKMESVRGTQTEGDVSSAPDAVSLSGAIAVSPSDDNSSRSATAKEVVSSPTAVSPVTAIIDPETVAISGSPALPTEPATVATNATEVETPLESAAPTSTVSRGAGVSVNLVNMVATPMTHSESNSVQDVVTSADCVSSGGIEENEAKKSMEIARTTEERTVEQEPLVYETKLEAKNAFKALLESSNVGSDWTWDMAMREIINDRRYGALRTSGERKQAFNEYLGQKKKQESEERRVKQKKAREDFKTMLEESKELTSSTRWSKAITIFEEDERFKAVERAKDREDIFEDYKSELEKKDRAKAFEEHKRNKLEYIEFLKSCSFIKASSQWRKVQDRLEADERCARLEKIDRLEIFQEYIRDLEKEEEEQRKLRMDEMRKLERKNRDEFRKLMEEHVAGGILTAKTNWREYCLKVKDLPAYLAVSSNTSGSTAKDLFEDVTEELGKQYLEDKDRIKEALKFRRITLSSTWTFQDIKAAILDDISSPPVSDVNLKLLFDELLERVKEKEEKEAKKRKRLANDFYEFLSKSKEITASSRWEDCKLLLQDRQESCSVGEESCFREIFEKYVTELEEKIKEKERKRREDKARKDKEEKDGEKKKGKQRREKERERDSKKGKERVKDERDDDNAGRTEYYGYEESRSSGRDKDKKHRKRHLSSSDDIHLDANDRERSKNTHRHSSDRKKQKQTSALTDLAASVHF